MGGGKTASLWPLPGTLLFDPIPDSIITGATPPFLRLLGTFRASFLRIANSFLFGEVLPNGDALKKG